MKHRDRIPGNRLLLLIWLLVLATLVQAAQISVRTDRNPVSMDESFQIIFDVEGEVSGSPDFSALEKDFQVLGTSRSLRTTFINGKMQRTSEYLVSAMPRRAGEIEIPPLRFGPDRSPAIKVRVLPAGSAGGGKVSDAEVLVEATVDTEAPYVQQQVLLRVRIYHRIQWREASLSEPEFRGGEVLVQKLGEDRNFQAMRDGRQWNVIERRYALFPQSSGDIEMDPLLLTMQVPTGERKARDRSPFGDPFFDDFFSRRTYGRKVVRSKGLSLKVKPVPAAFTGGHWLPARNVKLEENWSAPLDDLKAGEPLTRTLTLTADGVSLGQLPELAMPEVPGLRIYPDDAETRETATAEGVRSISTRKFAIIPTRAGDFSIPKLELQWWDVVSDSQRVATLPEHHLKVSGTTVQAPTTRQQPVASPRETATGQAESTGSQSGKPVSPALEERMPADVGYWLIAGNLLFLILWLVTLVAWWRDRRQRRHHEGHAGTAVAEPVRERLLWKALHRAAASGDAEKMRDAVLDLAPLLWPDDPPHSLEGMARRAGGPLADELNRLSRQLYGGGGESWNGACIERELGKLRGTTEKREAGPGALRPLFPASS